LDCVSRFDASQIFFTKLAFHLTSWYFSVGGKDDLVVFFINTMEESEEFFSIVKHNDILA